MKFNFDMTLEFESEFDFIHMLNEPNASTYFTFEPFHSFMFTDKNGNKLKMFINKGKEIDIVTKYSKALLGYDVFAELQKEKQKNIELLLKNEELTEENKELEQENDNIRLKVCKLEEQIDNMEAAFDADYSDDHELY